jgi:hypothetical protein
MLDLIYPIGLQILLPIGFLVWQWQERANNWLEWWLKTILIGSYLLGLALVSIWLVLPWYWGYVYLGVFGLQSVWSLRYTKILDRRWHQSWEDWLRVVSYTIAIAFCVHLLLSAGLAHLPPAEPPTKPSLPLKKGGYYIANGSNNIRSNADLTFFNYPNI